MKSDLHILLIGAGIGGLVAANALARFGFRVTLCEKSVHLREVGAGLTVGPNATHALEWLGLKEFLATHADCPQTGGTKHWKTGEVLIANRRGSAPLETYGANYYQIHRADLHGALLALAERSPLIALRLGAGLVDVAQTDGEVTAHFADGGTASGDLLVGADGIRSAVRACLFGPDRPRFTGQVAWRGLLPIERIPLSALYPDSCVFTGPDRILGRYKVRRGAYVNYVAIVRKSGWEEESWTIPSPVADLLAEYEDWHEEVRMIIASTPEDQCFKWALFDRDPLPRWTLGRATLLGDAAHPMLPFLGQGAAMAIEDGVVLARCLAAADSLPQALARYEKARVERAAFTLLESRAQGERMQRADPEKYDRARTANAEALGLFDYNPATVAV
jgi:salicylate hydroxylase